MNNEKRKKSRHVQVAPKIDNKPPRFDARAYFKAHQLRQHAERIKEIDKENMYILRKMNIITRMGGFVDCWTPNIRYKSKFEDQIHKNNVVMKQNRMLQRMICQASSDYSARAFLKEWRDLRLAVRHMKRYPSVEEKPSVASDARKQLACKSRTRCFFDVGLKEENQLLGRIVFELYDDIVPRTCKNFAAFCRGVNGLSYEHTPFHRIVSGYWCQGGDVTKFNGIGGACIYGDSFDNENFDLRHTGPGVLSTCADDNGKNDSKFNLTFKCLETVDGNKVVFGRVIAGMVNIYKVKCCELRLPLLMRILLKSCQHHYDYVVSCNVKHYRCKYYERSIMFELLTK